MGKEKLAKFSAGKKACMRSGHHFQFFLAVVTITVSVRGRLSDSTFALSMVRGSPSLHTPAATPADAVLAVAGTRPDSDMATGSCPSRAAAGRGPTVEWPLIAARVRATSVPACYVAPDHHPSLDVGQSRPMASAFARG